MAKLEGQIQAGQFRVEEEIGRGGMAEVYKVWDLERTTHLALKLLRKDLAQRRIFLRRFSHEAGFYQSPSSVGEGRAARKPVPLGHVGVKGG
ncbi:MAG: hypothetical protein PVJ07_08040 [Anaerolineales bacterium]|jgi:hypothetical protein